MNEFSVVLYMVLIASGALMAHGVDQRTATGVHERKAEQRRLLVAERTHDRSHLHRIVRRYLLE